MATSFFHANISNSISVLNLAGMKLIITNSTHTINHPYTMHLLNTLYNSLANADYRENKAVLQL